MVRETTATNEYFTTITHCNNTTQIIEITKRIVSVVVVIISIVIVTIIIVLY